MWRMPLFTWNMLVTSLLILVAFPPLTAALAMLFIDRHFGGALLRPGAGRRRDPVAAPLLVLRPPRGLHPDPAVLRRVTEIISVFTRKPVFGYAAFVLATLAIAGLSMAVWAHHMFTTGAVDLPFFAVMSFAIAVPTGIKFFNWIGTMWGGKLTFATPMLWAWGSCYLPDRRHHRRHRSPRRRSTSTSRTRTSWSPTSTTC